MKQKNASELLFEEYVAESGLGSPEHEPFFPRATKRIDYRLPYKEQTLWFEVKEFAEGPRVFNGSLHGAYDPHANIRRKLGKAATKFRDYDGECCSLVLFNETANLVDICTPWIVLGAMLGNMAFRIPINPHTGAETGSTTKIFTDGGKLIHPHIKTPQNTTISAVIAMERLAVGRREFQIKVAQKEWQEQRRLPWQELSALMEDTRPLYDRRVLRMIVYENPHAANPLPPDIFKGPFDERWGRSGNWIAPIYIGAELARLREMEHDVGLDISPIWRGISRERPAITKDRRFSV